MDRNFSSSTGGGVYTVGGSIEQSEKDGGKGGKGDAKRNLLRGSTRPTRPDEVVKVVKQRLGEELKAVVAMEIDGVEMRRVERKEEEREVVEERVGSRPTKERLGESVCLVAKKESL